MIIGIYGYPDADKMNFVERLIGSLVKKGYSVSSRASCTRRSTAC